MGFENPGLPALEPGERRTVLEAAWVLAAADGKLAWREKEWLDRLGAEAGLAPGESAELGRLARARELKARLPARTEARRALLDVLARLAALDGEVSTEERALLDRIAELMGLSRRDVGDLISEAQLESHAQEQPKPGLGLGELKGDFAEELDRLRALLRGRPRGVDLPLLAMLIAEIPIFLGVLFLGWSIYQAVLLFWWETVVIGLYNVPRMIAAGGGKEAGIGHSARKLFMIPFFMVHFGGFCFGHGTFLTIFFRKDGLMAAAAESGPFGVLLSGIRESWDLGMIAAAACILAGHGVSFFKDYLGRGEYRRVAVDELMFRPYGRIVVTHLALFVVGIPCLFLPRLMSALVVPLKMFFDVVTHRRERRRLERMDEELPEAGAEASWAWRHRTALRRLLVGGIGLAVLAVIVGGLIISATAPYRARRARLDELFSQVRPGMSVREALETRVPWTTAFTSDEQRDQIELRRSSGDRYHVLRSEGAARNVEGAEARKLLDEELPALLRNRALYLYVRDKDGTVHATFLFDASGRVASAGPTGR